MSGAAYVGADTSRAFADWTQHLWDANDEYAMDGAPLAARAWDLYRNDPYSRAMVRCMVNGILGPLGLPWRSLYSVDNSPATSDDERLWRRELEEVVYSATRLKRFDAGGVKTFRSLLGTGLAARWCHGDAFYSRVSKPSRPEALRDTCARLIDPARVENRGGSADSAYSIGGVQLDHYGDPKSICVRTRHPFQMRPSAEPDGWTDVPIFSPSGQRNVLHLAESDRVDQQRGVSEFSSNIRTLKFLADVTFYWVMAKKIQASQCVVVECDDPVAAAKADRNGALLSSNVGIKPGMKYYVPKGTVVTVINANFQGADYINFRNANLAAACAPWQLPYELVLCVLTGTNLSASRAAIGQFNNTLINHRHEAITQVIQPMVGWMLDEEVQRKFVVVPNIEYDRLTKGRFIAPPKIDPDPYKTMLTVGEAIDRGISKTTAFGWLGLDFEQETTDRVQNDEYADEQGLQLPEISGPVRPVLPDEPAQIAPPDDGSGEIPGGAVEGKPLPAQSGKS